MAKKDKKTKTAEKKNRVAAKTEKKAAQKEKKASNRPKGQGKDGDEDSDDNVDLEAVLAEYAAKQEQFLKVTEIIVPSPPSPRGSATLVGSPANANELFLFGGEYFNGALVKFYNDLFVYHAARDEWRLVTSPNSPLPRSGHAVTRGGNTGGVYLFGGEFSSPKQGTFYHYSDLWRLDPPTREWTKLDSRGKGQAPPARSGHRMTYFKQYIVLFGGFQDTAQNTKYLGDLWLYDTAAHAWMQPALPPASPRPDARSSFTLLPHEAGAVLFGGYARVKTAGAAGGGGKAARAQLRPKVYDDAWFLRITPPAVAGGGAPPTVRWERRKRPANAPAPARAGATMAAHRGRGIQFGGVHDREETDEDMDSEFFNSLFVWNVERNRFFTLNLRKPRANAAAGKKGAERGGRRGRGKQDEEELLRNLRALEMKGGVGIGEEAEEGEEEGGEAEEEEDDQRPEKPVQWDMPHPRFNAQLAVQDDVLYIFGGTFEKGDREYTLDEMWSVDLGKLDGVKEIYRRELEDWQGSEDEDDEDDDEDDDEEEGDEDEADDFVKVDMTASMEQVGAPLSAEQQQQQQQQQEVVVGDDDEEEVPSSPFTAISRTDSLAAAAENDTQPHPRPFESLRAFFSRTSATWQDVLLETLRGGAGAAGGGKTVKEMRKEAFAVAEQKWWDCREEVQAAEEEQEEAGIGEVVSLDIKGDGNAGGGGASGAGRRR